jgi:SAM-dependent methyltransferase
VLSSLRVALDRLPLANRVDAIELLDSGCLSLPEVEQNLADLVRLNRLPGGTAASAEGIRRLARTSGSLRVLDAGTGSADMPLAFAGHGWHTVALDTNPEVLVVARRETAGHPAIEVVDGDARRLPFADDAFDVAHCSLLIHHLAPPDAVAALAEMGRVARHGVVVNDLRRGILPLAATLVTVVTLGRSGITRQDGLASARRAYTLDELDDLLDQAGLVTRWRSSRWLPRVVTSAAAS